MPNLNTIFVPIVTGIMILFLGNYLVTLMKRYLKMSDDSHTQRYDSLMSSIRSIDKKMSDYCHMNHDEHMKAEQKLINHDHDPTSGKPRFYI